MKGIACDVARHPAITGHHAGTLQQPVVGEVLADVTKAQQAGA